MKELENKSKNILGVLVGMLIGGLAGAVTMLLMAPQSGKRTRKQIQQKGIELRDQAAEMVDDTMSQVHKGGKKFAKNGRQKAMELVQQGQDLVADQLEHVTGVVTGVAEAGKKVFQGS